MSKVVLVEDNEIIREGLQLLLNGDGEFKCIATFNNVDDLAHQFDEISPEFVMFDIGLPGVTGIDGIRKIRTISKEVNILVLTVYDDNDLLFEAIRAGANGYVVKNSPPEKIIDTMHDLASGLSSMSGLIAQKVLNIFDKRKKSLSGYTKYALTTNERKILKGLVEGNSLVAIAESMVLDISSIRMNFLNIYKKLQMFS